MATLGATWRERVGPRVRRRLPDLFAGFWFLAGSVAVIGPVLMVIAVAIDKKAGNAGLFPALVISPSSARTVLGSIATSLITVASLTSSLTIVTLQLLSSQYTPRTIRGFLRGRLSQIVFGTFIGVFVYCLLMLVTVREPGDENVPFVPSLGVVLAIALSLFGLGLLVVFIHQMSLIIQVSTMTARIARHTLRAVDQVHPHRYCSARPEVEDEARKPDSARGRALGSAQGRWEASATGSAARLVYASRPGFIRGVETSTLAAAATKAECATVTVLVRPGDFVTTNTPLIALDAHQSGDDAGTASLRRHIIIERERDIDQDPAFGIRQLVDIALTGDLPRNQRSHHGGNLHWLPAEHLRVSEPTLPAGGRPAGTSRGRARTSSAHFRRLPGAVVRDCALRYWRCTGRGGPAWRVQSGG